MKSASQIEAQAAEWIAERDSDAWNVEREQALERWLDEATAHRVAWLRLNKAWQRADRLGSLRVPDRPSVAKTVPLLSRYSTWRVAAGVALVAGLGAALGATGLLDRAPSFETGVGQSRSITLADGSRIVLNTDTAVRTDVDAHRRTVWLERGEAYFDVVHDPKRPFVVRAGGSRIDDIGTQFSVRRESGKVDVVVLAGKVKVSSTSRSSGVRPRFASRNDTVVSAANAIVVTPRTSAQVRDMLGWREGKLVLDRMTLEQAAGEFNRYNEKQLHISPGRATDIRVGGRFNVDNVEGFARLLHEGFGLKVVEKGNEIWVSG